MKIPGIKSLPTYGIGPLHDVIHEIPGIKSLSTYGIGPCCH